MSEIIFKKTLIIGLGLIGGSFAKALRQHQLSDKIFANDLDPDSLEQAIKSQIIDDFVMLDESLESFDLIVLATPLSLYEQIAKDLKNKISKTATIIDLGSVKDLSINTKFGEFFVPCHPIAGSEKTGFENSTADLFVDSKFIICPENCDKNAVEKITKIVTKIGAKVEFLAAKNHDEIYALVSHIPQFLSFLTKDFAPKKITDDFFKTAFRLDNSDSAMWSDIFKLNEENLEKFYLEFFDHLEKNIKNIQPTSVNDQNLPITSENFLEQNFAAIFFRVLVVKSYLEISDIEKYRNYAGSGFRDFTSIVNVLNYDSQKLSQLIEKNRSQILKFFKSIS